MTRPSRNVLIVFCFILLQDSSGTTTSGLAYCIDDYNCNGGNGGGTCDATYNYCICTAGFTGTNCQTDSSGTTTSGLAYCGNSIVKNDVCGNNPFSGGGTCDATHNYCTCNTGVTGTNCQTDSSGTTIAGRAYCVGDYNCNGGGNSGGSCTLTTFCSCNTGFTGINCQTDSSGTTTSGLAYCTDNYNCNGGNGGGTCDTTNNYCICTAGFTGTNCQIAPTPSPSPSLKPNPSLTSSPSPSPAAPAGSSASGAGSQLYWLGFLGFIAVPIIAAIMVAIFFWSSIVALFEGPPGVPVPPLGVPKAGFSAPPPTPSVVRVAYLI